MFSVPRFCPDDISWTAQPFFIKLGVVVLMRWSVMQKNWFVTFKIKVTVRLIYDQIMTVSAVHSKLLVHLQPNMVWWYSIICQSVLQKFLWLCSWSRSQRRLKVSVNISLDDIFWTTKYFVTRLGMVMQHHEPECRAENLCCCCCYLQGQSHSEGSYDQNITLSTLFWFLGNQTWSDDTSS